MRIARFAFASALFVPLNIALAMVLGMTGTAQAQTKVTIGKVDRW